MSTSHMPSSNYTSDAAAASNKNGTKARISLNNAPESSALGREPGTGTLIMGKSPALAPQTLPAPGSAGNQPSSVGKPPIFDPNSSISLDDFRMLMGIPLGNGQSKAQTTNNGTNHASLPPLSLRSHPTPAQVMRPGLPRWLRMSSADPEAPTSLYYAILYEESRTWRRFYLYEWLVYSFFILQLILSGVLVLLGALPQSYNITISVLAAISGVITGTLSLIRGQGLPHRLLEYADGLRRVREDIEWMERELRAGRNAVTFADAAKLRDAYETCRGDETKNRPDTWTSGLKPPAARTQREEGSPP